MFVINRMSKRLKSVMKKLFGGKSSTTLPMDTFFGVVVLPVDAEQR
jgi:hypothetical protein